MMKPPLAIPALMVGVLLAMSPARATGLMTCDSGDRSEWKPMDQLEAQMTSDGWSVRRIKEDGGCYEAYGTSPDGQRVEAYFHPVTLEVLLIARRGEVLFRKEN